MKFTTAPDVAVLRMTAELEAAGAPITDRYLVDRTVVARGILLNTGNRRRYAEIVDALVLRGHLAVTPSDELGTDGIITITDVGREVLADQKRGGDS